MKQQNSRMIAEVNKIIGNALVKDGGLYLPEIGSLSVATTPPSLSGAKGATKVPKRTVKFSTEERHRSLVLTISERGNCTTEQAKMIYNKWRETATSDTQINIDGVGALSQEVFTPSAEIITKLNPVITKSEEAKTKGYAAKKGGNTKSTIAVIALFAVVIIIGLVVLLSSKDQPAPQSTTDVVETIEAAEPIEPVAKESAAKEPATEKVVAEPTPTPKTATPAPTQKATPKAAPKASAPKTTDEIFTTAFKAGQANSKLRYKVIYGAFSTPENAVRAIKLAEKQSKGSVKCTVYNHGKSYIVSLYDTAEISDASRFINENKGLFKESLWIHKR